MRSSVPSRRAPRSGAVTAALHGLFAVLALLGLLALLGGAGVNRSRLGAVLLVSAPANDDFANATSVAGATFSGSTVGASAESGEPNAGAGAATVWFSWTPSEPGLAYLVPGSEGASTSVHVYTGGSLATLEEVGVSTSSALGSPGGGGSSSGPADVAIPAIEGTTYSVQVENLPGDAAAFSFVLTQPEGGPPLNDNFIAADPLDAALGTAAANGGSVDPAAIGTTAGATTEAGEPGPDGGTPSHTVWYLLDLPAAEGSGTAVSVKLTDATLPNLPSGISMTAFAGADVAHLTQLATSADGTLALPAGTTGEVRVSVGGAETYFSLGLTETGVAPPDTAPPVVSCKPPSGWTSSTSVACTATDAASPLDDAADASFSLTTGVPSGAATPDAATDALQICDKAGNCTTAGPYTLEVDRSAPVVDCAAAPSGWSAGDIAVTCTASDTGSGLADAADASFALSTDVPAGTATSDATFATHAPVCDNVGNCTDVPVPTPAKVDETAPKVSCAAPGTAWLDTQGSVKCTASDAASGLADPSEAKFAPVTDVAPATSDASAFTAPVRVCSAVGNCTTVAPVGPFKVDLSVPVVRCAVPTGFTKGSSVDIACTASDSGSGLDASSPDSFTLTASVPAGTEGGAVSSSRRICSNAGGCTTAGPFTAVGLDDKAPEVSCSSVPPSWVRGSVTVGCAAIDGGSGLADPSDAHFTLTAVAPAGATDKAVAFPRRTICDEVGNCAPSPALPPAEIDNAAPSVSCGPAPTGVEHEEVVVSCTATDAGSGLADPADASFELWTSVGAGHADASAATSSVQVCDAVGNCTTAGPFTADVDLTAAPSAAPPRFATPATVRVLDAVGSSARYRSVTLAVPFDIPGTVGGVGTVQTACSPGPTALFRLGLTLVTCAASDQADQSSEASFYVSAAAAPALAPKGEAVEGAMWRAVGADYAPGSRVTVQLGGGVIGSGYADARGRVEETVAIPLSTPIGDQTLVVRGTDGTGDPLLVVSPIVVEISATHTVSDAVVPGAPGTPPASVTLPPSGPAVLPPHALPVAGRPDGTGGPGLVYSPTAVTRTGTPTHHHGTGPTTGVRGSGPTRSVSGAGPTSTVPRGSRTGSSGKGGSGVSPTTTRPPAASSGGSRTGGSGSGSSGTGSGSRTGGTGTGGTTPTSTLPRGSGTTPPSTVPARTGPGSSTTAPTTTVPRRVALGGGSSRSGRSASSDTALILVLCLAGALALGLALLVARRRPAWLGVRGGRTGEGGPT